MIPQRYITEWRTQAPWQEDLMVEQDLIISRALSGIFSDEYLHKVLAFRGGTALHKLFISPAARYSEDIDMVQVNTEPIGTIFDAIRRILDPWLGVPRRKQSTGRATLTYRYLSEGTTPITMKLKIEINTREHFSVMPIEIVPYGVKSSWFNGDCQIRTFNFNELLATKLRALYQRKKGRDLFDLWLATQEDSFDAEIVIKCFTEYMNFEGNHITRAMFEENLYLKMNDPVFRTDNDSLVRLEGGWDIDKAYEVVSDDLICKLGGDGWAGAS